jgi:Zn-dependent peptidase ImmA (M78 family)
MMISKIRQSLINLFCKNHQVEPMVSAQSVIVPYLINDPSTPELVKEVSLPKHPKSLNFWVKGYNRGVVKRGTPQHQAANCYVTVASCIDYMQNIISPSLPRWAATNKLAVVPNAGRQLNAYYDRKHLKFFWDVNPKTRRKVYTADSSDIVAHELGHAILDAMRPDFWSVQALEIWSYHEAFSDITAILSLMQHDEVLEKALKETDGNLMKPNVISKLAEEMGDAIYAMTKGRGGTKPGALRDATRPFRYIDPSRLPKHAPDNKLAAECHSFGRVFLNAWYTIMVRIYFLERKKHDSLEALKIARDVCAKYLLESIPVTPRVSKYYQAAAKTFMAMDRKNGSPYQHIIKKIFYNKKILKPAIKMLSNTSLDDLVIGKNDDVIQDSETTIVKLSAQEYIKLDMGDVNSLSVGGHDLNKLDLEVPTDTYYEFNSDGVLVDEIIPDMQKIRQDAYSCILSIANNQSLGNGPDTMWSVEDNKLLRTYIE